MSDSSRFELLHENLKIKVENRSLSSELEETKKQKEFLIREYNQFRAENERLKADNEELKERLARIKANIVELLRSERKIRSRLLAKRDEQIKQLKAQLQCIFSASCVSCGKEGDSNCWFKDGLCSKCKSKSQLQATQSEPMQKYACETCKDTQKIDATYSKRLGGLKITSPCPDCCQPERKSYKCPICSAAGPGSYCSRITTCK